MCNIAGYTGSKRAAPVLIDMLRRQEAMDGGLSTGIATVHNGVLYHAKVIGDVKALIEQTKALDFPGNMGIIHSRPAGDFIENAHPFICENGSAALVANGNMCTDEILKIIRNSVVEFLSRQGVEFESARELRQSSYPQLNDGRYVAYGEVFAKTVEHLRSVGKEDYAKAMADASSKLFSDVVNVLISTNSPGNIYVSRISRPMNIMVCKGGSYISTSQLAFPKANDTKYIKSLPQMKSCVVSKDGFIETDHPITGGKVTEYSQEEYINIKAGIRAKLENEPTSMDTMGGGIFAVNNAADKLRPHVKVIYDVLWDLHKEGVLKQEFHQSTVPWEPESKVRRAFFYID